MRLVNPPHCRCQRPVGEVKFAPDPVYTFFDPATGAIEQDVFPGQTGTLIGLLLGRTSVIWVGFLFALGSNTHMRLLRNKQPVKRREPFSF
jgi:hypothetical protein